VYDGRSVGGQAQVAGVDVVSRVRAGRPDVTGPAGHQPSDDAGQRQRRRNRENCGSHWPDAFPGGCGNIIELMPG
jgi:hypothetical protein